MAKPMPTEVRDRDDYFLRMERAMGRAVAAALREHKLLGRSIVVADEHGQPKIIPPEEIVVPVIPDDEPEA